MTQNIPMTININALTDGILMQEYNSCFRTLKSLPLYQNSDVAVRIAVIVLYSNMLLQVNAVMGAVLWAKT